MIFISADLGVQTDKENHLILFSATATVSRRDVFGVDSLLEEETKTKD